MKHIEGNYYEHEGELYKKLKGTPRGYHIVTEEGKQGWLRLECTGSTRTDSTPKVDCTNSTPNDVDECCTESTPVQIVQDEVTKPDCTDSTDVQGVHPDSKKHYIKHINIEEEYLLGAYGINK